MMGNATFWTTFAQTAATLAGFTLAGFSIYLASTDRANSDDLCHQYGLHDDSSSASWAFIYLTLMLFCVPLLLSLIYVWGDSTPEPTHPYTYSVILLSLFFGFMIISIYLGMVQGSYFRRLSRTYVAEAEFTQQRSTHLQSTETSSTASYPQQTASEFNQQRPDATQSAAERSWFDPQTVHKLKVFVFFACIVLTLVVLGLNAINVLLATWKINDLPFPKNEPMLFSPGTLAMLSIGLGLLWIYCHFLLFHPSRLLFVINDPVQGDLHRLRQRICDAHEQIKNLQMILLPVVTAPDQQLLQVIEREERSDSPSIDMRLSDLKKRLEGWSWDPHAKKHEPRTKKLSYHINAIQFCLDEQSLRYGMIKQLLREAELYDLGLANLLRDLVYAWEQFRELYRYDERAPSAQTGHPVAEARQIQA